MTLNSRHNASRGGFTLIEMIVVLLILSVTAALIAPRVGSSWKRLEDGEFLQEFTETVKRARLFAINSGQPAAFRINGNDRVYGFVRRMPIPQNVEVFSERLERDPESGDFFVTFYPDGSLVGNDFDVVFDHARTFRVYINPLFGTVSVSRLETK